SAKDIDDDVSVDPLTIVDEKEPNLNDPKWKVKLLAKQFAEKIPENEFSPAQLQGYVMLHKQSPEAAVENVEAWVDQMRRERAEVTKKRRASRRKRRD